MAEKKVYPKGIRVFEPRAGAPDFVKGSVLVTPDELVKFCNDNPDLMTEYNGQKQLRLDLLDGKDGLYVAVNTYKKKEGDNDADLPF
jgi:hypothetical protein